MLVLTQTKPVATAVDPYAPLRSLLAEHKEGACPLALNRGVDGVDERDHLVHVDEGPEEPHADDGGPDDDETQGPALLPGDLRGLLHEELGLDEHRDEAENEPGAGASDQAVGEESGADHPGEVVVVKEEVV
eukprot:CAMPEP_0206458666 /NCGR_PEP_ID=MMETSP0324_2-20121206/23704_1 /ASSEMBLY_ACC=CAM_ASM_000836 /TAXON_ID=2866 /ORGANISM="Crypthecodinium cohnii, Strain Seligo" /LENGTH=131 /DNA_ID=CAMNT_0053930045 /DNA_START=72 /DNA_END=468 /DNA_ORIENTATION=-